MLNSRCEHWVWLVRYQPFGAKLRSPLERSSVVKEAPCTGCDAGLSPVQVDGLALFERSRLVYVTWARSAVDSKG